MRISMKTEFSVEINFEGFHSFFRFLFVVVDGSGGVFFVC